MLSLLWNNKNITIAGKFIYYKDWHAVGIEKIKDLLNGENKFTSFQNLSRKVGKRFPFTKLLGLINAIDHFHKWWPIINSFANIKISLTNLILKLIIQKSFYSETRLVRLI